MIVMMTAITPSLNASSRDLGMVEVMRSAPECAHQCAVRNDDGGTLLQNALVLCRKLPVRALEQLPDLGEARTPELVRSRVIFLLLHFVQQRDQRGERAQPGHGGIFDH